MCGQAKLLVPLIDQPEMIAIHQKPDWTLIHEGLLWLICESLRRWKVITTGETNTFTEFLV